MTTIAQGEVLLRLAIAVLLCGAIGFERQSRDQVAGLRTHIIVGLGAALFTLLSAYAFTGSGSSHVDLNGAEESRGIRRARARAPRRESSRPGIQRAGERL